MRGSRRRPKESLNPERPYFVDLLPFPGNRDSDASLCSSRPSSSSAGINRSATNVPINDRSYQSSALRAINTFLSSHSSPTFLKPLLPSAKDIMDALRFIFSLLDWPSFKLEGDLPLLLKHLNCPIKLNKSALRAPGTPHAWPSLLAVTLYNDHISSSTSPWASASFLQSDEVFRYICDSYSHYIAGDDDWVEAPDRENSDRLEQNSNFAAERVKELEKEVKDLEDKLEATRSAPSAREVLEKEKSVLENDVQKFHHIIEGFSSGVATLEKGLEEKEKELEAKEECKRICEENEELKRTIDSQKFNARDAERMKRELQAVERDIAEAEEARNAWEEKVWDLDTTLGHKLQELEVLSIECNQAIKKLKLGNDYHYNLNGKGSTPAEVLGIDYKSTLKPALDAFADNV